MLFTLLPIRSLVAVRILSATVLWITVGSLLSGCGKSSDRPLAAGKKPLDELAAETIEVSYGVWPRIARSQGELRADETVALGMRVAGRVAAVHVELGDFVKQGQPLVTLDPTEFELMVSQAEAQLAQARSAVGLAPGALLENLVAENSPPVRQEKVVWDESKTALERAKQLRQQNAIAQGEFDLAAVAERVAEARYSSALNATREKIAMIGVRQVELAVAKQRLEDSVARAPFDGFIEQRAVAPGAYVNIGTPLLSMVRNQPLWFRGTLPERIAAGLQPGLKLVITADAFDQPLEATVDRVSPMVDPQSRAITFEARIENKDNRLRAGLFAEAQIVLDPDHQELRIPASAISQFAGAEKVWKVVDGISIQHEVIVGPERDGWVPVIDGLAAGDVLLADGEQGRVAKIIRPKPNEVTPVSEQPRSAMTLGTPQSPEG